ncbi:MAG: hypothetical protein ACLP5V_06385, partial [Candidatus Bathyarchaeia archaeon]
KAQVVSVGRNPVPLTKTCAPASHPPLVPVAPQTTGYTLIDGPAVTVKMDCTKSPTLGAQPSFPTQDVTSITY